MGGGARAGEVLRGRERELDPKSEGRSSVEVGIPSPEGLDWVEWQGQGVQRASIQMDRGPVMWTLAVFWQYNGI